MSDYWPAPKPRQFHAVDRWHLSETAPVGEIVDVLFDPASYDMPEFYCPSGPLTGLWRVTDCYTDGKRWWRTDGLDALQKRPIPLRVTHWRPLPAKASV